MSDDGERVYSISGADMFCLMMRFGTIVKKTSPQLSYNLLSLTCNLDLPFNGI